MSDLAHVSWFLLESDSDKMFKCSCNYLSIGQFELARALLRKHFENECLSGTTPSESRVAMLLSKIIEFGPPPEWICSNSVSSTAHLLSMCVDLLESFDVPVCERLRKRCEFDLVLSLVYAERTPCPEFDSFSTSLATELRIRYATSLLSNSSSGDSLTLPRLLLCPPGLPICVLPSRTVDEETEVPLQLSTDLTMFIFNLCRISRVSGIGLLRLFHSLSSTISAQLTHVQAALVCDCLSSGDWEGVFKHLRFLNEQAAAESLSKSPLISDLMLLLVQHVNSKHQLAHNVSAPPVFSKFISECISFGSSKRTSRRPLFNPPADILIDFSPNEDLRLRLYESLLTTSSENGRTREGLIELVSRLEDDLLAAHCGKAALPPCFALDSGDTNRMFWDSYFNFTRMAKVHALKYPLETGTALIRNREFALADQLLRPFNQLKPLAILLCWDDFGIDIESRAALLQSVWTSYLQQKPLELTTSSSTVEDRVWGISRRFEAAKLAASNHKQFASSAVASPLPHAFVPIGASSGGAESVIDLMRQLCDKSLLYVMRATLRDCLGEGFVASLEGLPNASSWDNPLSLANLESSHDLNFARAYAVLRGSVSLSLRDNGTEEMTSEFKSGIAEIRSVIHRIDNLEMKRGLCLKLLSLCFLQTQPGPFTVSLRVVLAILCIVCLEASTHRPRLSDVLNSSRTLLLKFLVCLKESLVHIEFLHSGGGEPISSIAGWSKLLDGDESLGRMCDDVFSCGGTEFFRVTHSVSPGRHIAPPRSNMSLIPNEFIPRLLHGDVISTLLSLNDYTLAKEVVGTDSRSDGVCATESFATLRDSDQVTPNSLPFLSGETVLNALLLTDLSVSNTSISVESTLTLLRQAHLGPNASSPTIVSNIHSWVNKLTVLLEAKSEFVTASNVLHLSEIILGIETLPNEPELLKDHLTRMYSQRNAIMSLVDRVDQVRRGKADSDEEDFLTRAIQQLTTEGMEGLIKQGPPTVDDDSDGNGGGVVVKAGRGGWFLISFLEYLSKVCSLVQQAAPTSVSLFDVLSEDPGDLIGRLVFEHVNGFAQAKELCELTDIDLVSIVRTRSVDAAASTPKKADMHYISLRIVQELSQSIPLLDVVLLCLEKRTEQWPQTDILQYALSKCEAPELQSLSEWIVERIQCWKSFIFAHRVLTTDDVSSGLTLGEQQALSSDAAEALASVASDSQTYMNALAKYVARAHITLQDYISALSVLDTQLSVKDEALINQALMGCLDACSDQLDPGQIYQLLWRVDETAALVRLTHKFHTSWDSGVALRALALCKERLSGKGTSVSTLVDEVGRVQLRIRIVSTMASIVEIVPKWTSWQTLENLTEFESCVEVVSDLLEVGKHDFACEFLDLKANCLGDQIDALADRVELSRLGSMAQKEDIVERLRKFHHPVKASRLALLLLDSVNVIRDRLSLGQLWLDSNIACEEDSDRLETEIASLTLFLLTGAAELRDEWKHALLYRPDLVLESLLMNGVTVGLDQFFSDFPLWRNDALLIAFAKKALSLHTAGGCASVEGGCSLPESGLGGKWALSGAVDIDANVRLSHRFERATDVLLAIRFLNLLDAQSVSNAVAMFELMDALSRFVPLFVPSPHKLASPQTTGKCPFKNYGFLRQAVVALVQCFTAKFGEQAGVVPQSLRVAVAHAVPNLRLIGELWQVAGISGLGLSNISDPTQQSQLRDKLVEGDFLDHAEKVCYATGRNREGAQVGADMVTIRRVVLAIKAGEWEHGREVIESKLHAETLTHEQLQLLVVAMKDRRTVGLADLESALELLTLARIDNRPIDNSVISDSVAAELRSLFPESFFARRAEARSICLPSHMTGDCCDRCDACRSFVGDSNDSTLQGSVCIQTPHRFPERRKLESSPTTGNVESRRLTGEEVQELLWYCDKFCEGSAALILLAQEGMVDEAVDRAMKKNPTNGLRVNEHLFASAMGTAFTDHSQGWLEVLSAIRSSKEPGVVILSFLAAVETFLRSQTNLFLPLYEFEIALGREAYAGLVSLQLYLESRCWDERTGWLESARRHLDSALHNKAAKRVLQRRRRKIVAAQQHRDRTGGVVLLSSSSEEDEDAIADQERRRAVLESTRITVPFVIGLRGDGASAGAGVVTEAQILAALTLVDLQLEVCRLLPAAPLSASLFGSVQSVSEVIDYLLMDSHVVMAKQIVHRLKLGDSALCGIFNV